MPSTPPFPASMLSKLQARQQAVRWKATLKEVRQFRAYCCDIDATSIMGIAKEPVIFANISPTVVCLGESISWDISDSYAPGSTLTTWSVDFGDDSGSTGGATFPSDITSGAYTYTAVGTYTIEIYIEEGLGKNQTSEVEVSVVECADGPIVGELWSYASTGGSGVYYIDWSEASPTWVAKNTGLEGDALTVRSMVMKPSSRSKSTANHEIWIATLDGVYRTENGGNSWGKVVMGDPSNLEFGDSAAATEDELDWRKVVFDPTDEDTVYVLATKEA